MARRYSPMADLFKETPMNMTGNTILITGGSAGIGKALAIAFHQRGNQVIITGRRRAALEAVVQDYPGMRWMELDMQDADAIRAFSDSLVTEHPELNVLINNRSEEHTSELQSRENLVCRLLLEKKKKKKTIK